MLEIGLKVWSINKNYIAEVERLVEAGVADYVELYACPGSFEQFLGIWETLQIPYVIHAASFSHGLCLSKAEFFEYNQDLIGEALRFADQLKATKVIVHPGINGKIAETARQLKLLYDPRLLIENKPYYVHVGGICNGYSPEDIQFLKKETNVGFCLDFGHAICAANAQAIDKMSYVKKFLSLDPAMFHLTDGDWDGIYDRHDHFGKGSFKLRDIIQLLPNAHMLTIESTHDDPMLLQDFECDVAACRKLEMQVMYRLQFKRAEVADVFDVYALASDPLVRAMSFNSQPITLEDHIVWFKCMVDRPDCFLYMVRDEQQNLIGQVRFDKGDDDSYAISISLGQKFRGLGLGQRIIKEAIGRLGRDVQQPVFSVVALIKQENLASRKAFEKAGFIHDGYQDVNGHCAHKLKHIVL